MSEIRESLDAIRSVCPPTATRPLRTVERHLAELERDVSRMRELLGRTVRIATVRGITPVAEQVLDAMVEVLDAERGFLGIGTPEDWTLVAARHMSQKDVEDPKGKVSSSLIAECLAKGEPVLETNALGGRFAEQRSIHDLRLRSVILMPLIEAGGGPVGFVYLDDTRRRGVFDQAAVNVAWGWLPLVAEVIAHALKDPEPSEHPFARFTTSNPDLRDELDELARVARFDAPVLITGETGTGKSLLAHLVHEASSRAAGPFVHVNCGALPENLLEGELFGTTKGAYTGAIDREGRFEAADGGTLFLDELDSMPLSCQVKLLVTLQEGWITRLGSNKQTEVDVRVISAMNADPFMRMQQGEFREDLFYRIALAHVHVPSLRERPEDIPVLAQQILARTRARYDIGPLRLTDTAVDQVLQHTWPGNVRELENALDRAALTARDGEIANVRVISRTPRAPSQPSTGRPAPAREARPARRRGRVDEDEFSEAWAQTGGNVEEVADILGVTTRSVFRLKKRYGL